MSLLEIMPANKVRVRRLVWRQQHVEPEPLNLALENQKLFRR